METKEVFVGSKNFTVRELLAREADGIDWTNSKEALKKQIVISTGITEDEYDNLTIKERLTLVNAINDINGLKDFQAPAN